MSDEPEELDLADKTTPTPAPTTPRRRRTTTNEPRATSLKGDIRSSLDEVAEWIDRRQRRDTPPADDLAGTIRQQSSDIAEILALYAEKSPTIAKALAKVVGKGGPLSALRAFGPLARHVIALGIQAREAVEDEARTDDLREPRVDLT